MLLRMNGKATREWSTELEQGEVIETQHGAILINQLLLTVACQTTRVRAAA